MADTGGAMPVATMTGTHTLAIHGWLASHACPHHPQFARSVVKSTLAGHITPEPPVPEPPVPLVLVLLVLMLVVLVLAPPRPPAPRSRLPVVSYSARSEASTRARSRCAPPRTLLALPAPRCYPRRMRLS